MFITKAPAHHPPEHPPLITNTTTSIHIKLAAKSKVYHTNCPLQSDRRALPESSSRGEQFVQSVPLKPAQPQPNHHLCIIQSVRSTPRHCLASPQLSGPPQALMTTHWQLSSFTIYSGQCQGFSPIQGSICIIFKI